MNNEAVAGGVAIGYFIGLVSLLVYTHMFPQDQGQIALFGIFGLPLILFWLFNRS